MRTDALRCTSPFPQQPSFGPRLTRGHPRPLFCMSLPTGRSARPLARHSSRDLSGEQVTKSARGNKLDLDMAPYNKFGDQAFRSPAVEGVNSPSWMSSPTGNTSSTGGSKKA